jgi:hypothetical protein
MYEWVLIAICATIGGIAITRILRKSSDYELKLIKKEFKALEEYTDGLEKDLKSVQNSMNAKERGPQYEGEMSELKTILPELLGQFSGMAPKWMQPLLKNEGFSSWIAEYVEKNPEKAAQMFGKIFKQKQAPNANTKRNTEAL